MKKIALSGKYGVSKFALVDDEDFEQINKFKWYFNRGYAVRSIHMENKQKTEWMHRVVNKTPRELVTDHINGDGLDNRKENLRSCTNQQNIMNQGIPKNNVFGAKGVSLRMRRYKNKIHNYIKSQIHVNGKQIHLGYFKTVEDASRAYNEASKKYHGEYGRINP